MLGYINVNHNPIKFISRVLIGGNKGKKIYINYLTITISGVDIIR